MTGNERIAELQKQVGVLTATTKSLRKEVEDYQFQLECIPNIEHVPDAEVVDDIFMFMEQGVARFGYPRFQQLLDESLDRIIKYYGPTLYMKVR